MIRGEKDVLGWWKSFFATPLITKLVTSLWVERKFHKKAQSMSANGVLDNPDSKDIQKY